MRIKRTKPNNGVNLGDKIVMSSEIGTLIIGGGIMSAATTSQLRRISNDTHEILVLESLCDTSMEATHKENNAGTLHLGLMEPNYDFEKASKVYNGVLESMAILMEITEKYPEPIKSELKGKLKMAFVRTPGETLIVEGEYLVYKENKQRHEKWIKDLGTEKMQSDIFNPFENITLDKILPGDLGFSEENNSYVLRSEHPLAGGVDFGMLTQALFDAEEKLDNNKNKFELKTDSEVTDIQKYVDESDLEEYYLVTYTNKKDGSDCYIKTKSIFAGAGGYTLKLLEQADANHEDNAIFTVGGIFLEVRINNDNILDTISKMIEDYKISISKLNIEQLLDENDGIIEKVENKISILNDIKDRLNNNEVFKKVQNGEKITDNEKDELDLLMREVSNIILKVLHFVKRYGPAGIGSPPMSVPHLDYRLNYDEKDGKYVAEANLIFGPYATATTKVLKHAAHTFLETFKGEDGKFRLKKVFNYLKNPIEKWGLSGYLMKQSVITQMAQEGNIDPKKFRNKAFLKTFYKFNPGVEKYVSDGNLTVSKKNGGERAQVILSNGEIFFGTKPIRANIERSKAYISGILGASPGASKAFEIVEGIVRDLILKSKEINDYIYFLNKVRHHKGYLGADIIDSSFKNIFGDDSIFPLEIKDGYTQSKKDTLEALNNSFRVLSTRLESNNELKKDFEELELLINKETGDFKYNDSGYSDFIKGIQAKISTSDSRLELEKELTMFYGFMDDKEFKSFTEETELRKNTNYKKYIINFYKELLKINLDNDNRFFLKKGDINYELKKVEDGNILFLKESKNKTVSILDISIEELFNSDDLIFYEKTELEKDYEQGKKNIMKISLGSKIESLKIKADSSDYDKKLSKGDKQLRVIQEQFEFIKNNYSKLDFPKIEL